MYIQEPNKTFFPTEIKKYTHIARDGACEERSEPVLHEHSVSILIEGGASFRTACIPQYLPELALGRLLTEGVIASPEDVEELRVAKDGHTVRVRLTRRSQGDSANPPALKPIPWTPEQIFALADRLSEGMPLHRQTFATHSCFLAQDGRLLFTCEDIGRHNAIDKAVGFALRQNISLAGCILYSSGRAPKDMVWKAIQAGIPVFVSKASPTCEAAALAEQYGLTLVCAARSDRMKLFAGTLPHQPDVF